MQDQRVARCVRRQQNLATAPIAFAAAAAWLGMTAAASHAAAPPPAATVPAADSAPTAPAAEDVFRGYVDAIGGEEAVRAIRNRRLTGRYEGPPLKFAARLKVWQDAPDRYHLQIAEPAGFEYDLVFNGEIGWERSSEFPPRRILGAKSFELAETAQFFGEADWEARYPQRKMLGELDFFGTPVWVVAVVSRFNREHVLYFDKQTNLIIATRTIARDEKGAERQLQVSLSDYKPFGRVLYPTQIVQQWSGSEERTALTYQRVEINVDDPHVYDPPADMPAEPPTPAAAPTGDPAAGTPASGG